MFIKFLSTLTGHWAPIFICHSIGHRRPLMNSFSGAIRCQWGGNLQGPPLTAFLTYFLHLRFLTPPSLILVVSIRPRKSADAHARFGSSRRRLFHPALASSKATVNRIHTSLEPPGFVWSIRASCCRCVFSYPKVYRSTEAWRWTGGKGSGFGMKMGSCCASDATRTPVSWVAHWRYQINRELIMMCL